VFDPSTIALTAEEKVAMKKLAQWLEDPKTRDSYRHLFVDSSAWSTLPPLVVAVPHHDPDNAEEADVAQAFAAAATEKNRQDAEDAATLQRGRVVIDWDHWKHLVQTRQLSVPFDLPLALLELRTPAELTFLLDFVTFSREKRRVIDGMEEIVGSVTFLSGRLTPHMLAAARDLVTRARTLLSGQFKGRFFASDNGATAADAAATAAAAAAASADGVTTKVFTCDEESRRDNAELVHLAELLEPFTPAGPPAAPAVADAAEPSSSVPPQGAEGGPTDEAKADPPPGATPKAVAFAANADVAPAPAAAPAAAPTAALPALLNADGKDKHMHSLYFYTRAVRLVPPRLYRPPSS